MNKPRITLPVIVEGRYDKAHLHSLFDCTVIATDGFGIFNAAEKRDFLRSVAKEKGIIILTDSDGGGLVIRNYLKSILKDEKIIQLYIPQVKGKEKRKEAPSKEGYLGVEGISPEVLYGLFLPFTDGEKEEADCESEIKLDKTRFFLDGFSGHEGSGERRKALARYLSIPDNLSANAMIEAINMLRLFERYSVFVCKKEV